MRRVHLIRLAAAVAAAVSIPVAMADTATLNVSATVTGTCKMTTTTTTMPFGSLDPSAATPPNGSGSASILYKCTKGTSPGTFKVGSATTSPYNGTLAGSGTAAGDSIPYTITWSTPGAGTGFTSDVTLSLSGTILAADYINAKAGGYAEAVTVTLTP